MQIVVKTSSNSNSSLGVGWVGYVRCRLRLLADAWLSHNVIRTGWLLDAKHAKLLELALRTNSRKDQGPPRLCTPDPRATYTLDIHASHIIPTHSLKSSFFFRTRHATMESRQVRTKRKKKDSHAARHQNQADGQPTDQQGDYNAVTVPLVYV